MEISILFLAVILLMVVLIGLVFVIIHSLSVSAGIRIRSDTVRMLRSYDNLLESKSDEIVRLQNEAESIEKRMRAAAKQRKDAAEPQTTGVRFAETSVDRAAVNYRLTEFGSGYGMIRRSFELPEVGKEKIVDRVRRAEESEVGKRGEIAARLKRQLDFDLVFRLSQMNSDDQLALLESVLENEDRDLLKSYCESDYGSFEVSRFADWLDGIASLESGKIEVLDSNSGADGGTDGCSGIYEGIRVLTGNKLYDYSIGEREIG